MIALIAVLAGGCGTSGPTGAPSGPDQPAPVRATAIAGPYRLTLELPRAVWALDEPITGAASLVYAGPGVATVSGSGSGLIVFGYTSATGRPDVQPATTDDCVERRLPAGAPVTVGLTKSGGWGAGDPDAAFLRAFLSGPDVILPAGTWRITAIATFDEGRCTASPVTLRAAVEIVVVED